MTASTIATSIRGAVKTAIAGVAANTYDSIPESPIVPFAVVEPSNPYLEPNLLGSSTKVQVNLLVTVGVGSYSNAASLDNIEKLVMSILAVIPQGYTVGAVSQPIPMSLAGGSIVLACDIQISTQYTQTN